MSLAALDWRAVAERRTGHRLGSQIVYREHLDSTNTLAASLIPAHFLPPTSTSFGHFSALAMPADDSASPVASPQTIGIAQAGVIGPSTAVKVRAAPGEAIHRRPSRPLPAIW